MEGRIHAKLQRKREKAFQKEKEGLKDWKERLKKIYAEEVDEEKPNRIKKSGPKKVSRYHNEMIKFQKIQEEKAIKKEEFLKKKQEKEDALAKYNTEQKRKRKLLYKKNVKGQPNMECRMKLLLEKIQKQKE